MSIWPKLQALKDARPLVITLVEAPGEFAGALGETAIFHERAEGFLSERDFWPRHFCQAALLSLQKNWPAPEHVELQKPEPGWRYFITRLGPARTALVLGGGHVGQALGKLLPFIGYETTLADERPEFALAPPPVKALRLDFDAVEESLDLTRFEAVIIVTRGHASDLALLRRFVTLPAPPAYLGMIGSRRRARDTLNLLAREGVAESRLAAVKTPVGLSIGAETPEEIAVSICAQLIECARAKG